MAETDRVFRGKLKQSGIFSFSEFYEFLYDTLMDENFEVFETRYAEIKKGTDSKNVEINWNAEKAIPGSNYFKFVIGVRWLILGLKKTKVRRGEQEVTMDSGTIDIDFTADLIKDPNDKWDDSFFKFLKKIYEKFIIKNRIEDYEEKLFEEINDILSQARAFLAIEGQHNY